MRKAFARTAAEWLCGALIAGAAAGVGAAQFSSYAIVNDDATLAIKGRRVRLFGIYIPTGDQTCRSWVSPVRCGPRPVLALDFKIGSSFVQCDERGYNEDGTVTAACSADGEDLSRWMLSQGMAAALPDAPFEYQLEERLAERHGLGIWGIPLDNWRPLR